MSDPSPGGDLRLSCCVCAGCGCLCDDLGADFRGGSLASVKRACLMGEQWLRGLGPLEPTAMVRGKPTTVEKAIAVMAESLAAASSPVIIGLTDLTVEALQAVASLAASTCAIALPWPEPPAGLASSGHQAPECSATLGEVRATADLVVFWRADPARTHPRHLERYSLAPKLIQGNRVMLVVDADPANETAKCANEVLSLGNLSASLTDDVEIARSLRLLFERSEVTQEESPSLAIARRLQERLRASRHAHFFLGEAAAQSPALWDEVNSFAARVREKHRVTVSALSRPGNARGVVEVLSWSLDPPDPATSAGQLMRAGAADLICAIGLPAGSHASAPLDGLAVPRISIGRDMDPKAMASIQIPGLDPRLSASVVRSDGIHLSLDGREGGRADPAVEIVRRLSKSSDGRAPFSPSPALSPTSSA